MPTPEELAEQQKQEQKKLAEEARLAEEKKKETQQTQLQEDPRIKALNDKLDNLTQLMLANAQNVQRATVETPKAPELPSNKEVWDDPVNAISKIIAAQNAPLNQIAKELAADKKASGVKEQIMLSPQYQIAKERYPDFERHFASQLSQVPSEQLSVQSAMFVLSGVVGSLALNTPAESQRPVNNGNSNPSNTVSANIPAHLRPTPQNIPQKKQEDAEPELNETERILANRYGMTPKEYKAMQDGGKFVLDPLNVKKGA